MRFQPFRRRSTVAALVLALAALPALAAPVTIVALGDSLTAGLGLDLDEALPARLEAALRERGHDVRIVNAGVSGDTAAAGLARVDWSVGPEADGVIVELGANDALRGLDPADTEAALDGIVGRLRGRGLPVLLAGMLAPPNLGSEYGSRFAAIYPTIAGRHGILLYPFILDGVAAEPALNQGDGLHPNAAGVDRIVERILPAVEALLAQIPAE